MSSCDQCVQEYGQIGIFEGHRVVSFVVVLWPMCPKIWSNRYFRRSLCYIILLSSCGQCVQEYGQIGIFEDHCVISYRDTLVLGYVWYSMSAVNRVGHNLAIAGSLVYSIETFVKPDCTKKCTNGSQ